MNLAPGSARRHLKKILVQYVGLSIPIGKFQFAVQSAGQNASELSMIYCRTAIKMQLRTRKLPKLESVKEPKPEGISKSKIASRKRRQRRKRSPVLTSA